MKLEPLSSFGAVVAGVDLARCESYDLFNILLNGLRQYKLLIFPKQHLSCADLEHVISSIGDPLEGRPPNFCVPGFSSLTVISNIFERGVPIGIYDGDEEEEWHMDHCFCEKVPSVSMLYSVKSATTGGQTRFADTTQAVSDLNFSSRCEIEGLRALHSLKKLDEAQRETELGKPIVSEDDLNLSAWHPMLISSDISGKEALLIGRSTIESISSIDCSQKDHLLQRLEKHCTQAKFVYDHNWADGDLAIWDNIALAHTASPCNRSKNDRYLYRSMANLVSSFSGEAKN